MKKSILLIGAIFCMVPLFAQVHINPEKYGFKVWTGQQVPDFQVKMTDGKTVSVEKLRGKVVLIDFLGTQCSPCIQGMKRFKKEIFQRFTGKELVVLPIVVKFKDKQDVKDFQKRFGFDFPMGLDEGGEIASLFFKEGIPRYFVIDRKGQIVYHGPGYENGAFEKMVGVMEQTLKQQ